MNAKGQSAVRKIDALPFVRDMRAGLSPKVLMDKYGLSKEGFQKIHGQIHKKSSNLVESMVNDILFGIELGSFLEKYNIPYDRLDSILNQLLKNSALNSELLAGWKNSAPQSPQSNPGSSFTRYFPSFPIVVCDLTDSANRGLIVDIDEQGLGTKGIESEKGKVVRLAVLGDEFGSIDPFEFNAVCRWARLDRLQGCLAGFQIDHISSHDVACLRKLLQLGCGNRV
jgi:hypothetical protein